MSNGDKNLNEIPEIVQIESYKPPLKSSAPRSFVVISLLSIVVLVGGSTFIFTLFLADSAILWILEKVEKKMLDAFPEDLDQSLKQEFVESFSAYRKKLVEGSIDKNNIKKINRIIYDLANRRKGEISVSDVEYFVKSLKDAVR